MQHFLALTLTLALLVIVGCGGDSPIPTSTPESPAASTPPAKEAAADEGASIIGHWGMGEDGVKMAMDAMMAEAGDDETAKAMMAMLQEQMRETMALMIVEVTEDALINYSPQGEDRLKINSMTKDGNVYTIATDEQTMKAEWKDPVLQVWAEGDEKMKMNLNRLSDDQVKESLAKIAAKKAEIEKAAAETLGEQAPAAPTE